MNTTLVARHVSLAAGPHTRSLPTRSRVRSLALNPSPIIVTVVDCVWAKQNVVPSLVVSFHAWVV